MSSRSAQKADKQPVVPELLRHERVDLALRQGAVRLHSHYLEFAELAHEAVEMQVWTRFGYVDAEEYFKERIGISYRTLRRWLSIHEGLLKLSSGELQGAKAALLEIGAHKAAVLAPILGRPNEDWRKWIQDATVMTEEALQEAVSEATGARPRGLPNAPPGDKFLGFILNHVPPECREEVETVFRLGMKLAETTHPVAVFLAMIAECRNEWELRVHHGVE